jgi:SPOR domain
MQWVERIIVTVALTAACIAAAAQTSSEYGKIDTFAPGKKYTCVPTADKKSWDCKETGNAPKEPATSKSAPTPTPPQPVPTPQSAPESARSMTPVLPPTPSETPTALPSYLRAQPAPITSASTSTAKAPPPPTPVAPPPIESKPPAAPVASTPVPQEPVPIPQAKPIPAEPPRQRETTPPPAPRPVSTSTDVRGNREFLALPAAAYVIELAHGSSRSDLSALHESLRLPNGDLYELHLTRDGGDWWTLVWASFESISAARAARSQLPADAAINAGWPRPIAPLQNEARRRLEQ